MKAKVFKLLCATLVFGFLCNDLFAGYWDAVRGCFTGKRYHAWASLSGVNTAGQCVCPGYNYRCYVPPPYGKCNYSSCSGSARDRGCTWAEAHIEGWNNSPSYQVADAHSRIGSTVGLIRQAWSNVSCIKGGELSYFDNIDGDIVDGFTSVQDGATKIQIHGGANGNGIITIQNLDVILKVAVNSKFGASFRIIIWKHNEPVIDPITGDTLEDFEITSQKVLWEASVRIEYGQMITTGAFNTSNFLVYYTDEGIIASSTNEQRIIRVMNISPTDRFKRDGIILDIDRDIKRPLLVHNPRRVPVDVINGANANNLTVTLMGEIGYGTFRDNIYTSSGSGGARIGNNEMINEPNSGLNGTEFYAFPQPFSEKTTVIFRIPENQQVRVEVFGVDGRLVKVLFDGVANKEEDYYIDFNAANLPAGVYICRYRDAYQVINRKLLLAKW